MKILPIVIVLAAAVYFTPLYPVYALKPANSTPSGKEILRVGGKIALTEGTAGARLGGLREKFASREAMLKEKLAAFRDKVKARKLQNINDTLAHINKIRTDAMLRHYDRMSEILTKIEDRVNNAESNGQDMTSARSSISKARTALEEAKKAIDAQVENDYTIDLTDEVSAKSQAKAARQDLFEDLKEVHDLLITARKSIVDAVTAALTTIQGGSKNGQQ